MTRSSLHPMRFAISALLAALSLGGCGAASEAPGQHPDAGSQEEPHIGAATSIQEPLATANTIDAESPSQGLAEGLRPFQSADSRYADVAEAASRGYAGRTDPALLDESAGPLVAAVLHGPLSVAALQGKPLGTLAGRDPSASSPHTQGALFPGWPVAILSRAGIVSQYDTRSLGTSNYYNTLEELKKYSHQKPWWSLFSVHAEGQQACVNGGSVDWTANLIASPVEDERRVTWNDCQLTFTIPADIGGQATIVEDIHLHGSMRLYRTQDSYQIAWDNLVYAGNGYRTELLGTETSYGANGCGFDRRRHTHVLLTPMDAGSPVLIENVETAIVGEPNDSRVCGAAGLFQNYFHGRLLHAELGAVSISTPHHLSMVSLSDTINKSVEIKATDTETGQPSEGMVVMEGQDVSQVTLTPFRSQRHGQIHDGFYDEPFIEGIDVLITPADRAPLAYRFARPELASGVLSDFADSDSDGVPNAWEDIHGNDRQDPLDGAEDADADGLSALDEFRAQLSPHSADAISSDASLVLQVYTSGNIGVSGYEAESSLRRHRWRVTLTIDGNAYFAEQTDCASIGNGARALHCEWQASPYCDFDGCRYQGLREYVQLVRLDNSPVSVTALLEPGALDSTPDNDTATVVVSGEAP